MEWLNYHHLLYFWMVAKEGGLEAAGRKLHLANATLSGQIHRLEESLGEALFDRSGRRLALTETGRLVFRYADEIFPLGRELMDAVRDRPTGRPLRLEVGIVDVVPKPFAALLLEQAQKAGTQLHLVCREGKFEPLLGQLAAHSLDVVISDAPVPPGSSVRAFHHPLGECGVVLMGTPGAIEGLQGGFPACLDGAPMLLPTDNTSLRRSLAIAFDTLDVRPRLVGEFEDAALMTTFGQAGHGLFPMPDVLAEATGRLLQVRSLGVVPGVRERYYAVTVERRVRHPAVTALLQAAREVVFSDAPPP